jgi:PAS domain S-box-containing protein
MLYTPYIWPELMAVVLLAGIALYARRFRALPSARSFSLLTELAALATLIYALNIATPSLPLKILWHQLQYLLMIFIPPLALVLALEYTGQNQWLTRKRLALIMVIPLLTVVLWLTTPYHTLLRYDFRVDWSGPFPAMLVSRGPFFWVYLCYSYALLFVACWQLLVAFPLRTMYFYNALLFIAGLLIPVVLNVLFQLGLTPIRGYDWSRLAYVLSGILGVWALSRGRLFEVALVARRMLVETIDDVMVVVDRREHIVDFNRAAQSACGLAPRQIGATLDVLPTVWRAVLQRYPDLTARTEEVEMDLPAQRRIYELSILPVQDTRYQTVIGRLFVWRDITARKRAETALLQMTAYEERRRLARDLHDSMTQSLHSLTLTADTIQYSLKQERYEMLATAVDVLGAGARQAQRDMRLLLYELQLAPAGEIDLLQILQGRLENVEQRVGITTHFSLDGAALIPENCKTRIFYIATEALNNALKHAQADTLSVQIRATPYQIDLTVTDNGRGFQYPGAGALAVSATGMGLCNMLARAAEHGDALTIESAPGQGTTIHLHIEIGVFPFAP